MLPRQAISLQKNLKFIQNIDTGRKKQAEASKNRDFQNLPPRQV